MRMGRRGMRCCRSLPGWRESRVEPFHTVPASYSRTEATPWNRPTKRSAVPQDAVEEGKLIRRMQLMMNLVMQTIAQDSSLTIDEASQMIADSKKAALAMFPDKELAYEIIWRPRFQRLMRERFRIM